MSTRLHFVQVYSTLSLYRVRFRVSSVRVGVRSGADVRGGRGKGYPVFVGHLSCICRPLYSVVDMKPSRCL